MPTSALDLPQAAVFADIIAFDLPDGWVERCGCPGAGWSGLECAPSTWTSPDPGATDWASGNQTIKDIYHCPRS